MNSTQLRNELEQCLSWAEYANDFECFELFDSKIAPLDSEYFSVEQVKALYHYVCEFSVTFDDFYCRVDNSGSVMWIDRGLFIGVGLGDALSAANDLLDKIVVWYNKTCTRL